MKISTSERPIADAMSDFRKSIAPSVGPTEEFSMIFTGTGSAPALSSVEMRMTSSSVKLPVVSPSLVIVLWMTALLIRCLSRKTPSQCPMFLLVRSPNFFGSFVRNVMIGLPVGPKLGEADFSSAPV